MKGIMQRTSPWGDYQVDWGKSVLNVFFNNLFSSKIRTEIEGVDHFIKPDNLWHKQFSIFRSKDKIGQIRYGWKGRSTIELNDNTYFIKSRGFWKPYLEVRDEQNDIIMEIRRKFNWSKFKNEYSLNSDLETSSGIGLPLLFALSYCVYVSVNHYFTM